MKLLLVHPDDSLEFGSWAKERWDWAIDLGWSGRYEYARLSERLGFPVSSIYDILDHRQHRRQFHDLLALGLDQLVDSENVDWWDLFCSFVYQEVEQVMVLSALAEQLPDRCELFATKSNVACRALSILMQREVKYFSEARPGGLRARPRRYLRAAFALRPAQMREIAFDKWDPDFRFRRHFSPSQKTPSTTPAILLPSAYSNVSRAQVSYARMLPNQRFLLIVTRDSGRLPNLPSNVELRSLASYAPGPLPATGNERDHILSRWRDVLNDLFETNHILSTAKKLNIFDGLPSFVSSGLGVRDAWREVLTGEPITAVLSADENNAYTKLPIVLANARGLRTVFCDHGALNMSVAFRPACSDTYLLRGEMARDYSIEQCGLPADKIVVGGSAEAYAAADPFDQLPPPKDWIVFYSEAYEVSKGRTQRLYTEILPGLCSLARRTNRKVIVKLHPFESFRMRKRLVEQILPEDDRRLVEIREGPMTRDLFSRAWCSLTVESSVAVESTLNGVPCFLCAWFDSSWYGYGKQYAKFSAGYPLDSPEKLRDIPELLADIEISDATKRRLHTAISHEQLSSVLLGSPMTTERVDK